ncbi:MAG: hypothetical protein ACRELX_10615, partial [Longimicrobiales bacterium]
TPERGREPNPAEGGAMEASHVRLLVVVVLLLAVSVVTVDRRSGMLSAPGSEAAAAAPAEVSPPPTGEAAVDAAEIERVRGHLLRVERELLAADISHLTPAQRANRMRQIGALREYRERGLFPHNHEVERGLTPVFIDEHGTHCAVGYLIARSGREELARMIAGSRNHAFVENLADIPALAAWLEETGLSVDEAARIQPQYGWHPPAPRDETGYSTATAVFAAFGGGVAAWNLLADRTGGAWWLPGAAGMAGAAAGLGLAWSGHDSDDDLDDIEGAHIAINAGIGVLAGLLGARTLVLGRADRPTVGNGASPPARPAPTLSLSPWSGPNGGAGLHLGLRF